MADYRPSCVRCGGKGTNSNNRTRNFCSYCKLKLGAYTKPKGKNWIRFCKERKMNI